MKCIRLALTALMFTASACAAEVVYYPQPESPTDRRSEYPVRLLELAFAKAGRQVELKPSPVGMLQSRSLLQLRASSPQVTVFWSMTTQEREQQVLPVRIPIDKGLLGLRLLLVKKGDRDIFSNVRTAGGLFEYTAGLGHDWPDVAVFKSNGLKVSLSHNYELLFRMLANGKFHYFPRSVAEVFAEQEYHARDLEVADHIAIYYHAPLYYFVNQNSPELAKTIESGLEKAIKDGSFERLFQQYYGEALKRARLEKRAIIHLANPALPSATPLDRAALWYRKMPAAQ